MTWQGAGGTDGGRGDPDDATRTDWTPDAPPVADPDPFAPGGPLADDAALPPAAAPVQAGGDPGMPPADPVLPPPASSQPSPLPGPSMPPPAVPASTPGTTPWAPPEQGGGSWGTPPGDGGRYAVPGAPGLIYAGAIPRAAAYIVDGFLIGIVSSIVSAPFAPPVALDANGMPDFTAAAMTGGISAIVSAVVSAAYFILLWTSSGRATLGMRLFNLQVGNAADGFKLRMDQAVKRWFAFGSWLGIIPVVGLVQPIWQLVLLITTATSPTKQGLHDRIAESAVVRPASAGNGLAITCLVLAFALPLLILLLIVPLIFLGGQVSDILSSVGESI
jgi:uncharacterized RDD family membrane protein YckC